MAGTSRPGRDYGYAPPHRARRRRRPRGGGGTRPGVILCELVLVLAGVGAVLLAAKTYRWEPAQSRREPAHVITATQRATHRNAATVSRLYRVGHLPATGCRGRRIVQGDPASFRAFLDATTDCLDSGWGTGLARARVRFAAPGRVFWSVPGRGPCGDYPAPRAAAFYCPANSSIYIGVTDTQRKAGGLPVRFDVAYAVEIGHEYGHAVQDLIGILDYGHDARAAEATVRGRNAVTKRSELQAQCLSGVFMASVSETFPVTDEQWEAALRDSYGRGDDRRPNRQRDHGTNAHYRDWLETGYRKGTTAACNTWVALPDDVS